ncbi:kelch-like protein 7 [Oculina patagonica]
MSLDLSSKPITETDNDKFCVEMMKRLDSQRRNEQFCDVILEVGSGDDQARLKAHRIVLCAASPFFYNALNSDMKEKKEGMIRLEETSKAVMEEVLEYLYRGHVDINEHNAFDLLQMAEFLVLSSLKELSSKFILQTLTSSNCIMAYHCAGRYQCPELEKRARNFVFENFMDVTQSDDFLNLSVTQVEKWVSSDDIIVKGEEEVFQVILKWTERDESRKHRSFLELFRHIRLVYVSRNYVFNVILPHPLVKDSATCTGLVLDAMKELTYGTEECYFTQPPRSCLKTHEDAIVACGKKKILCYLSLKKKWFELASRKSAKTSGFTSSACHGKLYVTGENSTTDCGTLQLYDPVVNSCGPVKSYNETTIRCSYPGVTSFQGFLFTIGGIDKNDGVLGSVHKYNPDTNLWQEVAALNIARCGVCAVADKNSLFAIGGYSADGESDIVERFDSKRNSWSRIASMPGKKTLACGIVVKGKVFVFGGYFSPGTAQGNVIEIYDPAVDMWSTIEWMNAPKRCYSAVNFKGKVFVLALSVQGRVRKSSILVYDVDKNEWEPAVPSNTIIDTYELFTLAPLRIPSDILNSCNVVTQE